MISHFQKSWESSALKKNCHLQLFQRWNSRTGIDRLSFLRHTRNINTSLLTCWHLSSQCVMDIQPNFQPSNTESTLSRLQHDPDNRYSIALWPKHTYWRGPRLKFTRNERTKAYKNWVAWPVLFAPTNDTPLRLCAHYTQLNAIKTSDSYTLSKIDECIDSLWRGRVSPTRDANNDYWQTDMDTSNCQKTAITSHHALYKFNRMLFCLKIAPATFRCIMNVIMYSVKWKFALIYTADLVFFLRAPHEHINHAQLVLSLLREVAVTWKLKTTHFSLIRSIILVRLFISVNMKSPTTPLTLYQT